MAEYFPADWREQPCYLVPIPKPLIPLVGGMLNMLEYRGFWATPEDYERGYTATVEFEANLMANCITEITQRQDALYRLMNTALLGVAYETVSTDPLIVEPAIAPHVNLDIHDQDSLLGRLDRLTQLTDNTFNGTETPLYDYVPSVKDQLQTIIDGMTDETEIADILAAVQQVVLLLGA